MNTISYDTSILITLKVMPYYSQMNRAYFERHVMPQEQINVNPFKGDKDELYNVNNDVI
jgi:hypothetical protein